MEQIFGVLQGADDSIAVELELAAVGVGELPERVLVAGPGADERPLGHHGILAARCPSAPTQAMTPSTVGTDRPFAMWDERISAVQAFADAITERDLGAALELCHPEIEFFS